eukprot:Rmarinus@m.24264
MQHANAPNGVGATFFVENQASGAYGSPPQHHRTFHRQTENLHSRGSLEPRTHSGDVTSPLLPPQACPSPTLPSSSLEASPGRSTGRGSVSSAIPRSTRKSQGEANVRVVVRVRPQNSMEVAKSCTTAVHCLDDGQTVQVDSVGGNSALNMGSSSRGISKTFSFNSVLPPSATQETVFEQCGIVDCLDSVLNGYSATLFAYGQTGSGKTYTVCGVEDIVGERGIRGCDASEGLMPRVCSYLFQHVQVPPPGVSFCVRASFFEIYNEQVQDLLNPSGALPVRWESQRGGFFVENLFVVECESQGDLLAVMSEGIRNRRVGSHELNKDSTRAHSLLTIHVERRSIADGAGNGMASGHQATVTRYGRLTLVDLAGSERLKETKSTGTTLKETGNINRSLFTLGQVISSLSDRGRSGVDHIPYRDSTLTKLLMDCLGGNSLCIMVATCSPTDLHAEETLRTLTYANRAGRIRNRPLVNMDERDVLIESLRTDVGRLTYENEWLRSHLGVSSSVALTSVGMPPMPSSLSTKPSTSSVTSRAPTTSATPAKRSPMSPVGPTSVGPDKPTVRLSNPGSSCPPHTTDAGLAGSSASACVEKGARDATAYCATQAGKASYAAKESLGD